MQESCTLLQTNPNAATIPTICGQNTGQHGMYKPPPSFTTNLGCFFFSLICKKDFFFQCMWTLATRRVTRPPWPSLSPGRPTPGPGRSRSPKWSARLWWRECFLCSTYYIDQHRYKLSQYKLSTLNWSYLDL